MSVRRRLATLGVAVGGVLAGHWLTYLAIAPGARARAATLRETGHGYLGPANDLALVIALTALAAMFIGQLTKPKATGRTSAITRRIVTFQVSAFVILEVVERLSAGAQLPDLVGTGVLPLGIVVQIAVSLIAASAIRWLLRMADRVATALARAPRHVRKEAARRSRPPIVCVPVARQLSASGVRGPPLLSV